MAFSSSTRNIFINNLSSTKNDSAKRKRALGKPVLELSCARRASSSSIVHQAARLFAPATRFEASKLKVVFLGEEKEKHPGIIPRIYTVTHCDLTANLTLAISDTINIDQLSGWYNKLQRDDVVADWKKVKEEMSLHVHCHVSGAHPLLELAAEFRYHIFTKELPLVLKAVIYGDSVLFNEHPELMEAQVWVYFHSNLNKYNRIECWGPLKDAAQGVTRIVFQVRKRKFIKHGRAPDRSSMHFLPCSFDEFNCMVHGPLEVITATACYTKPKSTTPPILRLKTGELLPPQRESCIKRIR